MAIINMIGYCAMKCHLRKCPTALHIEQYFSHIRMMIGKYDWFCEMKCRSGSERITRAFRTWERYFCTGDCTHSNPDILRVSRNWDYFQLCSYLNELHFELNTFSFTSTQQFKKYRCYSSCQINNEIATF